LPTADIRRSRISPVSVFSAGLGWLTPALDTIYASFKRYRSAVIRRAPSIMGHAVLCVAASYLACWLRFDGDIPPTLIAAYLATLPWLLLVRGLIFVAFGLYSGLWRYTSVWDLTRIVTAVGTSSVLLYLFLYWPLGPGIFPRSIVIIDSMLLVCFLGGVRLLWRVVPSVLQRNERRRVLIIGAGDAGDMIVREMLKGGGYRPVGYIDDDVSKVGRTIHGVEVLGTCADLPRVVASTKPGAVLVAIPSRNAGTARGIVQRLEGFKLSITTLPSLAELVNGQVGVKQIRPLAIEDLLPRGQVALDTEGVRRLIRGKRVLVTGAGGSIGSELCRQIAALGPSDLVLYERYENSLYAIANDLIDRAVSASVHSVIGDVTDASRVSEVFAQFRPHLVFHAAAHKHVPLMEASPCEAVKNNVIGTRVIAEAARQHGVERFVLISTDKAANPSSVMGATKRVAELIVQALGDQKGKTRFVTVRFGNVLGSNGSVIPRMMDQIRAGGPVTVTHPDIRRYFMLIPEAVQLVLQAAVLVHKGQTFVLDMGEQLKVLDVARNLIRLSGFVPDQEIPITFIGLRPGEKLVEELFGKGELLEPSSTDKIFVVRRQDEAARSGLNEHLTTLLHAAMSGHSGHVIAQLSRIVPTFKPHVRPAAEPAARLDVSRRWPPDHEDATSPETAAPIAIPAHQN
jgi:FlaA1/EpsC-like NDP-sugar epimerase